MVIDVELAVASAPLSLCSSHLSAVSWTSTEEGSVTTETPGKRVSNSFLRSELRSSEVTVKATDLIREGSTSRFVSLQNASWYYEGIW